ncbi:MAG: 2-oxoacid:acceptor oxidoreductase subunit alpha, partial [Thermoplasmata archaeon]
MNNKLIKPGNYFMNGNFACAEGALIAGLEFYAGYPITPSSEIMERLSYRLPQVGGHFIEMEDEIASMAAIIGASNAGAKSMTATSGPGFSLMQENIGLAIITETPVVIVDEMRGGPSTGLPTRVGQGDVMQAMWGTHGDHEAIVYAPNSVQEMFDLTIKAFNTAEKYRYPVIMLTDQVIGHMSERLTVKQYEEYEIVKRELRPFPDPIGRVHDFTNDFVSMVIAGKGFHYNIDSLTHDEKGYPSNDPMVEEMMVKHLLEKIRNNEDKIVEYK